jgi:hypothetical protein
MYKLVDRFPVTACHAPLHQNSEVRSLKVMNFTVFSFSPDSVKDIKWRRPDFKSNMTGNAGFHKFSKTVRATCKSGAQMVTSILMTRNFGPSCKPHRYPSLFCSMRADCYVFCVTSILKTHSFGLSCKPLRYPSPSAPCMRIAMFFRV